MSDQPSVIESAPEPVLNTYLAIQLLQGETPHDAIRALCQAGKDTRKFFRRVEVLDVIPVANRRFVRCRSDVTNLYPILDLLLTQGRGSVAVRSAGQYHVRLSDGRTGPVSVMTMHALPLPGQQRLYRGPKLLNWTRQFQPE